jgi:hypothetical protein
MVRNECVRFGGHTEVQVSYKILWLEYQRRPHFCTIYLVSKRGCFEGALDLMGAQVFRGEILHYAKLRFLILY